MSNITYSYSNFAAQSYTFDGATDKFEADPTQSFGDASFAQDALNLFKKTPTVLGTYYRKAFTRMTSLITLDQVISTNQKYVVIFMSDGEPSDTTGAVAQQNLISNLTMSLVALGTAGQIIVNSIY